MGGGLLIIEAPSVYDASKGPGTFDIFQITIGW